MAHASLGSLRGRLFEKAQCNRCLLHGDWVNMSGLQKRWVYNLREPIAV